MFRLITSSLFVFGFVILNTNGTQVKTFFDIETAPTLFHQYMQDFDKKYDSESEMVNRLQIFKQNLIEINRLNEEHSTATFGLTTFADWTTQEFMQLHTVTHSNKTVSKRQKFKVTSPVEETLDWREKGVVTEVKNQMSCGSSWAFSVTGEIESQHAIHNGTLINLSEQQLVDCSFYNAGCGGGLPHLAMRDVIILGGLEAEESYPYVGIQKNCSFQKNKVVAKIHSGSYEGSGLNGLGEFKLSSFLSVHGPLIILLEVSPQYQHYTAGVLYPTDCIGQTNHAMLLVGYGKGYWIIKNSWGKNWGEGGYVRFIKDEMACSIGVYFAMSEDLNLE